jgi:hypothetical protein
VIGEGYIGGGEWGSIVPSHTSAKGEMYDRLGQKMTFVSLLVEGWEGEWVKIIPLSYGMEDLF